MELGALAAGALIGSLIAIGGFALRRKWTPFGTATATCGGAALALLVVAAFFLVLISGGAGGDAGMAAVTVAIFVALGAICALLLMLVAFAVQRTRLEMKPLLLFLSLAFEIGIGLFVSRQYNARIAAPAENKLTNEWWKQESWRREAAKNNQNDLAARYQGITPEMIDQHNQMRREMSTRGVTIPPMVPPNVEAAIRNQGLNNGSMTQAPRPNYSGIRDAQRSFNIGLGAGWFIAACLVPVLLAKKLDSNS